MTNKLRIKLQKEHIKNIEIRNGYFPDVVQSNEQFDSIVSSFMFAHLTSEMRTQILFDIHSKLKKEGRIGLFSAQGEIASTFETKGEIYKNLKKSGFSKIQIKDVADIYRITTAKK